MQPVRNGPGVVILALCGAAAPAWAAPWDACLQADRIEAAWPIALRTSPIDPIPCLDGARDRAETLADRAARCAEQDAGTQRGIDALRVLEALGDDRALAGYAGTALNLATPTARRLAVDGLERLGAVEPLAAAACAGEVRAEALGALARVAGTDAIPVLAASLQQQDPEDWTTGTVAAEALVSLDDPVGWEAIAGAIGQCDRLPCPWLALRALREHPVGSALVAQSLPLRLSARTRPSTSALTRARAQTDGGPRGGLPDEEKAWLDPDDRVRAEAARREALRMAFAVIPAPGPYRTGAVAPTDRDAVLARARAASSDDPAGALVLLAAAGAPEAVATAVARLDDADPEVADAAAWALGTVGDAEAVRVLVDRFDQDATIAAHARYARALGRTGARSAWDAIAARAVDRRTEAEIAVAAWGGPALDWARSADAAGAHDMLRATDEALPRQIRPPGSGRGGDDWHLPTATLQAAAFEQWARGTPSSLSQVLVRTRLDGAPWAAEWWASRVPEHTREVAERALARVTWLDGGIPAHLPLPALDPEQARDVARWLGVASFPDADLIAWLRDAPEAERVVLEAALLDKARTDPSVYRLLLLPGWPTTPRARRDALLRDDDPEAVLTALRAWVRPGWEPIEAGQVLTVVAHPDPRVRMAALRLFAALRPGEAAPVWRQALADLDPAIVDTALTALERAPLERDATLVALAPRLVADPDPRDRAWMRRAAAAIKQRGGPLYLAHQDVVDALLAPRYRVVPEE